MSPSPSIRLDVARQQARRLEDALSEMRQLHAGENPQTLAALLEPLMAELLHIRGRIDAEIGLEEVREGAATLWLRFKGRNVGAGRAPAQMVGKALAALQKGARQASGYLELGVAATRRLTDDLALATELDVMAFGTGSLTVAIAPRIEQLSLTEDGVLAERGLGMLIRAARWAEGGQDDAELDMLLPNAQVRRQLVNRIRELAPSHRADYETLELSGAVVLVTSELPEIVLSQRAFSTASGYLRRRTEEAVAYSGKLVMVDIERGMFDLRIPGRRIHCYFDDAQKERAKALVEHFVAVEGQGSFELEAEDPYRIVVLRIRELSPEEQARIDM